MCTAGVKLISVDSRIFENVYLGENAVVEEFVILGCPPVGVEAGELATNIGDNAVIRAGSVIYSGSQIGHSFQTGNKANVREQNLIGNNVSIGTHSVIEHNVEIEDGVRIHSQVFVPEFCTLRRGAWLGPNVVLTNAKYPNSRETKRDLHGVQIGELAIIGANATIMPGIVVGDGAVVGAGSIVTKDVAPQSVVHGNPAVHIKFRDEIKEYLDQ